MELSESLKRFRKRFNFSQEEVASKMKVSRPMYQAYEYGKSVPSITVLTNLADACGVSLDYLAGRIDEPYPYKNQSAPAPIDAPVNEPTDVSSLQTELTELKATLAAKGLI